jgi:hypothetical protein
MKKMLSQKRNNGAYFFTCITLLWIFFQYVYAIDLGNYNKLEAMKYFNAANYFIENGTLPNMRYLFYGTITGLIGLHLKFKFSVIYIIAFQLLFNLFAIQCFGYVIKKKYGSIAALASIFLLVASYDWTIWNFYLYSESTFFSFTLLWLSSLLYFSKPSKKVLFLQCILLMGCIFSRPIGVGYILIYGFLFFMRNKETNIKLRIGALLTITILFFIISYIIVLKMEDHEIYLSSIEGCIICGVPTDMKLEVANPQNFNPILLWIELILSNPLFFIKLFFLRIFFLFSPMISHFSLSHNIQNLILCTFVYLGLFFRFYRKIKLNHIEKSICIFLIIFIILIGLQCNDWSRRFYSAILPFLIVLGVTRTIARIQKSDEL